MSETAALQTTLAAEHAAVYMYGVLGGRTSRAATPQLFDAVSSAYAAHRARRDHLVRELTDLGVDPVAADPAYEPPRPLDTPAQVERAGLDLERSCARTYAYLVASTVEDRRRWAVEALNETAVRELAFRGTPETFPGADEHADR
ncbi:ferritin-like domain-containing protein [Nocardioides sp.]|uniref:ferritin-like domain-containing protein n=1 Tax=Nocardioides sp. TaxID=35761 RepID=UPI0037840362